MENVNIKELNDRIQKESAFVDIIQMEMNKVIVGQKHLVEDLLIGLLADGHLLLEGMPGLAKTLAISTLSDIIDAKFQRIQFTPDLLPSDIVGTMIYSQKNEQFQVKKGPSLPMKSTVLLQRFRARSWRPCRKGRLQSVTRHTSFLSRSL